MEIEEGFVLVNESDCVDPYKEAIKELGEVKKQLLEAKKGKGYSDAELQNLRCKYQELETKCSVMYSKSTQLLKEREELTQRLSKEMSDKLSSDESNVENVSIKNRPMVVAEEYERLFSEQWLDVKTMLDAKTDLEEERKISLLCDVIMEAVTIANNKYKQRLKDFEKNLSYPLRYSAGFKKDQLQDPEAMLKSCKRTKEAAEVSLPDPDQPVQPKLAKCEDGNFVLVPDSSDGGHDNPQPKVGNIETHIMNEIGDYYRKTADNVDIKGISADINTFITQTQHQDDNSWFSLVEAEGSFQDYIHACARIAWKMAIQRPSMTCGLQGIGERWNELTQEASYHSDDPTHDLSRVKVYQYPALYHDKKLMVRGKVILKIQQ